MSTYSQLLYHIVFSTFKRSTTLHENGRPELFAYIWGILKNKKCHLYRINGMEDHLHIFTHIPTSLTVASLVKDIKLGSSKMIKENNLFEKFSGWQEGYGAFTVGYFSKDNLIDYVKKQQEHHRKIDFIEEYKKIWKKTGFNMRRSICYNSNSTPSESWVHDMSYSPPDFIRG